MFNAGSSNGRTAVSGTVNSSSNLGPAILKSITI